MAHTFPVAYPELFARHSLKSPSYPEYHVLIGSGVELESSKSIPFDHELSLNYDVDDEVPTPTQLPTIVQGELCMIPQMPVDILYEIFSHLHPQDLLNLSRTTWSLRHIVTARHSIHTWRSSLANIRGLPPCPPDLTEIQYASLAFDDHCHFCLAPDVHEVFWICRVRCCTKCIPQHFRSESELMIWIPETVFIEKPHSIFPYITSQQAYQNGGKSPLYFFPAAKEYLREMDDTLATKDDNTLTKWIQKKKDVQAFRVSHAQHCQFWIYRQYRTWHRPQPSNHYEKIIALVLLLILAFLRRDRIISTFL